MGHWHHYHSMGSHHFGRNLCNCVCCFLCIGPILFLVGFGLLVSSLTDFRTPHIVNYNDAVNAWTAHGLSHLGNFENTRNVVNVTIAFDTLPLFSQLPNTSKSESYIHDDDERILTYSQYQRFMSGLVMDLSTSCSQYDPWYGCDMSNLASFKLTANGQDIYHGVIPAFSRVQTFGKGGACPSGEFWNIQSQSCDAYSVISEICVKLKQTAAGWSVDDSYGGVGCGQSAWGSAAYTPFSIYSSRDFPKTIYVPLSVRSVKDPRVAFNAEMGPGATSFGLTQGAKASTGAALLIIGGVILFVLIGTCCKLTRLDRQHRYYEDVRAPVMVVAPVQPVYYQQPPAPYPPMYQQQPPVYYQQGPGGQIPVAYAPPQ